MANVDETVRAYGAAWLEVDEAERRRLLQSAWSEDGIYQDPTANVVGREALIRHIADFHKRLPGTTIIFASGVDHHHGKFHFLGKMIGPDRQVTSKVVISANSMSMVVICRIVGFFGHPHHFRSPTS
ncbi:hypothetical protein [Bradyrhizobium japonicum]|uniref:hypothetical protein n=1 Tax=Bradyrhizobium japonicum TaxID=375 RepID=UPI00200D567E|nr:hypothetical protein [Bradyrhizobium japonicum]UQD98738.1 nuclear transport factor 2 family protein [Bradyrhizobium japonicum]